MNRFENWFCGSSFWRIVTERRLLPWLISGYSLGDHVLEIGAGPGATTRELQRRSPRVTSLEYDHAYAAKLRARQTGPIAHVLQADAAALPFPDKTFSSVVAILVLHHLLSPEQQDHAFAEFHRVLRPAGVMLAFEIQEGRLQRFVHKQSTFIPVDPAGAFVRLNRAGFAKVSVDFRNGGFRVSALRAREATSPAVPQLSALTAKV